MTTSIKNENGIIETTYDSSNIASSSYDTTNYTLYIKFVKGGLRYKYINVSPYDYNNLQDSKSTGKAFIEFIKNKYKGERI
jgi:hypothetical protein